MKGRPKRHRFQLLYPFDGTSLSVGPGAVLPQGCQTAETLGQCQAGSRRNEAVVPEGDQASSMPPKQDRGTLLGGSH